MYLHGVLCGFRNVRFLCLRKQLRAATHKFSSLLAVRPGIFQTREEEAGSVLLLICVSDATVHLSTHKCTSIIKLQWINSSLMRIHINIQLTSGFYKRKLVSGGIGCLKFKTSNIFFSCSREKVNRKQVKWSYSIDSNVRRLQIDYVKADLHPHLFFIVVGWVEYSLPPFHIEVVRMLLSKMTHLKVCLLTGKTAFVFCFFK